MYLERLPETVGDLIELNRTSSMLVLLPPHVDLMLLLQLLSLHALIRAAACASLHSCFAVQKPVQKLPLESRVPSGIAVQEADSIRGSALPATAIAGGRHAQHVMHLRSPRTDRFCHCA